MSDISRPVVAWRECDFVVGARREASDTPRRSDAPSSTTVTRNSVRACGTLFVASSVTNRLAFSSIPSSPEPASTRRTKCRPADGLVPPPHSTPPA